MHNKTNAQLQFFVGLYTHESLGRLEVLDKSI